MTIQAIPEAIEIEIESSFSRTIDVITWTGSVSGYRGKTHDKAMPLLFQNIRYGCKKGYGGAEIDVHDLQGRFRVSTVSWLFTQIPYGKDDTIDFSECASGLLEEVLMSGKILGIHAPIVGLNTVSDFKIGSHVLQLRQVTTA